jgi:hypothetical protein
MARLPPLLPLAAISLAACSTPAMRSPSLSPRTTEAIDPRVPVVNATAVQPTDPGLAQRLAQLLNQARAGEVAFRAALAEAQRLAAAAGGRQSEGWIAAQQALSVAVAARAPTTRALGDIDELGSERLAAQGGLGSGDFAALRAAAAEVAAIDRRQADGIDAVQRRLGG